MSDRPISPKLSVVVVTYRMPAQVGLTLQSLSPTYQRFIDPDSYEVILVDNGSPDALPPAVWGIAPNVHYHHVSSVDASPNPGVAMNWGVQWARAPILCLMIDGARLVTPAVLHWGLAMTRMAPTIVTEVRGWHLGLKNQSESIEEGYSEENERALLDGIGWPENGYRLFEIGAPSGSSPHGFFGPARESTCLFMHRTFFDAIHGFDERYESPGGGLGNVDFFRRTVATASTVFTLLGEGTFHQAHGGASTGLAKSVRRPAVLRWRAEYERLSRPIDPHPPRYEPILVGHVPRESLRWLASDWMP